MITIISGTNRPDCKTLKVAQIVEGILKQNGEECTLLNLQELPPDLFEGKSYGEKPEAFAPFQQAIFDAKGILTITPEYNGSFPGVLKYFIDMLKFPESLKEIPAGFIGLAAGEWGGLRPVEQIELVFQYRSAHIYGRRVFIKKIYEQMSPEGELTDPTLMERLENMVLGFVKFSKGV